MEKHYVRAVFNLACNWEGVPPVYRIYVNDELFTERLWRWNDNTVIREILQLEVPPGKYHVRVEALEPCLANFITSNHGIEAGPAHWKSPEIIKVKT